LDVGGFSKQGIKKYLPYWRDLTTPLFSSDYCLIISTKQYRILGRNKSNTFISASLTRGAPILLAPADKTSSVPMAKAQSSAAQGNHGNQDKPTQIKRQMRILQLDMLRMKRDLTRFRGRNVRLEKQHADFNLQLLHFERKDDERERKLSVALEELRKCQTELCGMKQIMQSRVSPPVVEK
jgi:hypothetical protein